MGVLKSWWWLLKRILVYVPLGALLLLSYIFIQEYLFILNFLFWFPSPTKINAEVPKYDVVKFGAPIRAGFAKADITPPYFSWVAGFMPPHPAFSIKDRLWVKSLALEDQKGNRIVIVSCDIIGLLPDEINKIVGLVEVPRNNIFLSTTHTHSGPDTMGLWIWKNERYMRRLRTKIAKSINQSIANMEEASIRFGQGEFSARAHGRDENPADPTVSALQVLIGKGESPQLITLVNFACHPDVVQGFQISADFPYFLSERLQMRLGSETMFISGAIGGVQPTGDRKELAHLVRVLGEDLADKVVAIMRAPKRITDADIAVRRITVRAPFENTSDLKKAVQLGFVSNLLDEQGMVAAEVNRIDIGPIKIFTVPGELFPKIWWRVKGNKKNTIIFGLVNGEFGYILLSEDYKSGKHKYHVSVSVGPTFGEEIDKALQRLAEEE
jgi:hypothetical protein